MTNSRLVLIYQETRLEKLTQRYNTIQQASFYIEHLNEDFSIYLDEHDTYKKAFTHVQKFLEDWGKLIVLERSFINRFLFDPGDIIYVLGQDGLVANTIKYMNQQIVIGINPDPNQYTGILLPFNLNNIDLTHPNHVKSKLNINEVTLGKVVLKNKQELYAVNDFYIGRKTHVSSRYELRINGRSEKQSSSGIIVSTGMGSTGWLKSVLEGAKKISHLSSGITKIDESENLNMPWDCKELVYSVREPYPSAVTGTSLVYGKITKKNPLSVASLMPENGVIFSDGIEDDFLDFNAGMVANISIAEKKGYVASLN